MYKQRQIKKNKQTKMIKKRLRKMRADIPISIHLYIPLVERKLLLGSKSAKQRGKRLLDELK